MGCCESSFLTETHPEKEQNQTQHQTQLNVQTQPPTFGAESGPIGGVPSFSEFSFSDLKAATNNFSSDYIVSESGEKAPNLVYKGRLHNRRWIAVKKFTKLAWPDPKQFAVQSLHLFHFFIGFLIVLDSEESWVCVKIESFFGFFFFFVVGCCRRRHGELGS